MYQYLDLWATYLLQVNSFGRRHSCVYGLNCFQDSGELNLTVHRHKTLEIMSFEQALLKDSLLVFRGLDRIEVHFSSPLGLVSLVTTAVSS